MINKVILVGNVGADPEIKMLDSGVKVARLRLATTERITDKTTNETREQTEWHNVILWRALADVADKYVRKGSRLYVEGKISYREWQDKEGVKHTSTDITANEMKMLNKVESAVTAPEAVVTAPEAVVPAIVPPAPDVDDLPF